MRKVALNLVAFLLVIAVFKSCSKDSNTADQNITAADIVPIKSAITSGDWHISYFFDTDMEETENFAGYVFTFNADGTLGTTDGNSSISGAWSLKESVSSNVDFNIFFPAPDNFKELSEDWEIKKYSSTHIELMHVSGGNGGTDLLTFMKN